MSCLNCERELELTKNYCYQCYPIIYTIDGIKSNKKYPKVLQKLSNENYIEFKKAKKYFIKCKKTRLSLIKDSYVAKKTSAHELESIINKVSKTATNKTLGKFNDELEANLNSSEKAYMFKILSRILLQKRDVLNYSKLLEYSGKKSS